MSLTVGTLPSWFFSVRLLQVVPVDTGWDALFTASRTATRAVFVLRHRPAKFHRFLTGAELVVSKQIAKPTTILVCVTCRAPTEQPESPRAGQALADSTVIAAAAADEMISVRRVSCLANCSRGLSAAIRCASAWTYIFGGLIAERDGETLVIGARLLAAAEDGLLPWTGRPEPLKRGLIARVPPALIPDEPS
jgi:predicted metal-binding protein